MADITLTASPVLGIDHVIGKNRILERADLALVSVAIPLDGAAALSAALNAQFKLPMPTARQSSVKGNIRAIKTSPDQIMLVFPYDGSNANEFVQTKLGGAGYTTEQTDSWFVLEVSGPETRNALERICPLDLHGDVFPIDANGRTNMEHINVLLVRLSDDRYLMMSPRSSAQSFLHTVEVSFSNVGATALH